MRGGGALFANENNTNLENEKILLEIKKLQADFENEDSLKKRSQIQNQIDTLKKRYTDNVLADTNSPQKDQNYQQDQSSEKDAPKVVRRRVVSREQDQEAPKVVKRQVVSHEKDKTYKEKQSGFFLGIAGGALKRETTIDISSYLPLTTCYSHCEYGFNDDSGGGFLSLGIQRMWNDYFGERYYFSAGAFGAGFWSINSDFVIQIPIGKLALGIYFGLGSGFFWNSGTYEIDYISKYSLNPKSEWSLNVPAGIALVLGHSRIELGYFGMLGIIPMYSYVSTKYYAQMSYHTLIQGVTLGYQYVF